MFYAIANVPRFWQELCLSLGLGPLPSRAGQPRKPSIGWWRWWPLARQSSIHGSPRWRNWPVWVPRWMKVPRWPLIKSFRQGTGYCCYTVVIVCSWTGLESARIWPRTQMVWGILNFLEPSADRFVRKQPPCVTGVFVSALACPMLPK